MKKSKETTFDPYDFSLKTIDGVSVYYKNLPTSPCIHIRFCFDVGAINDPVGLEGISHFLEHLIFDGSPKIRTKKKINEWSKLYALNSWNAWTWWTNTTYHLKCLPEDFDKVISGMTDMIFKPLLKESDVKHELSVITQEAWGVFKNEKYLKYTKEILDNVFSGTEKERLYSPLGWPESIKNIKQNDIKKWHKQNYGKGNFFVVMAGNIESKHLKKLESVIKTLPEAEKPILKFGKIQKPKENLIEKNSEDIGDPIEQVDINIYRIKEPFIDREKEVVNMSRSFLQDILFERMRTEKALCYGVDVFSDFQRNFFQFGINVKAKEENKDLIIKEFHKALKDILNGKEKKRFAGLKKVNINKLKSQEDTTKNITEDALYYIWKYGKVWRRKDTINNLEKVSYEDIVNFLKQTFDKNWAVTEVILPSKK